MSQERTEEAPDQDIRSAVGEGQAARAMRKPMAEEVASELEAETGNTQKSSSAESEAGVVGGDEIEWGEEHAKGEGDGVVAVGEGNLIGREDIQRASDKTVVEVHGGQVPSEEFPKEGVCGKADYMKAGRGGHVEMEAEADRLNVRLGRHSRSGHVGLEAKKEITERQI